MNTSFYGNSIAQWVGLVLILGLSVVVSRVTIWRLSRTVRKLFKDENTELDDLLGNAFERPLFFMLILVGIWLAFKIMTVSPGLANFFDRLWQFLFTLTTTWMIASLYDVFHAAYLVEYFNKRRAYFDVQILEALKVIMRSIIWVMGVIMALNNVGYDMTAVLAGIAIGGLAFALAAQDTVANLFGGVTLFTQQPFKVGEVIEVEGIRGRVEKIGFRTSNLRDEFGHDILVPNKYFSQNPVKNISSRPGYAIQMTVPLGHTVPPAEITQLMDFIEKTIHQHADVLPGARVSIRDVDQHGINIEVFYEIKKFEPGDSHLYPNESTKISGVRSFVYMAILMEMERRKLSLAVSIPSHLD